MFHEKGKNKIFDFEILKEGAKELERKEELLKLLKDSNSSTLAPLIDKLLFVEKQLDKLEALPMIKVHPENPEIQKATPAAKLYKEFLQQYTNIIKTISSVIGDDSNEEESPLRKWVKSQYVD